VATLRQKETLESKIRIFIKPSAKPTETSINVPGSKDLLHAAFVALGIFHVIFQAKRICTTTLSASRTSCEQVLVGTDGTLCEVWRKGCAEPVRCWFLLLNLLKN